MRGTKAPRFRYQALVTDSLHLREAAKVHDGSQGAAAQAPLGALTTAVASLKAPPSIA